MTLPKASAKTFWESRILDWEAGRYSLHDTRRNWLERLADRSSNSLRFRMETASSALMQFVPGRRVLELGCGSGRLAARLIASGATEYTGVDIAQSAVDAGNAAAEHAGLSEQVRFVCHDVTRLDPFKADIVFSLGLFDWLTPEQIRTLFASCQGMEFMHSISEQRGGLSQRLHQLYVYLAYGHKSGGYVPQYYSIQQMREVAGVSVSNMNVFRHPRLHFGAIITSLPLPNSIQL